MCVKVCMTNGITISKQSNKKGYFPAVASDGECTGCGMCAIVCPDAVIEVMRDKPGRIESVRKAGGCSKANLVEESK